MPDTFRAADLDATHLGRHLQGEGVDGVLRGLYPVDDLAVQLLVDRSPYLLVVPAGRPIRICSRLDCPPA